MERPPVVTSGVRAERPLFELPKERRLYVEGRLASEVALQLIHSRRVRVGDGAKGLDALASESCLVRHGEYRPRKVIFQKLPESGDGHPGEDSWGADRGTPIGVIAARIRYLLSVMDELISE